MFLVCGVVTIVLGILVIIFLPDNPMSSRLSPRDKYHAIERVRGNKTGVENKQFDLSQMIEALRDPHVWTIVVLMITASEINGALSNYQASIIKSYVPPDNSELFPTRSTDLGLRRNKAHCSLFLLESLPL